MNILKLDHVPGSVSPLPTPLAVAEVAVADPVALEVAVKSSCHIIEFRESLQFAL